MNFLHGAREKGGVEEAEKRKDETEGGKTQLGEHDAIRASLDA